MQRNASDQRSGVVVVGAFKQARRALPVRTGGASAAVVSLAAYRAMRSIRKGHAWLELSHAGTERD